MDWFYLLFNLCILAGPLLGSWLWLPVFWRYWRSLLLAWATVSVGWVVLDVLSVRAGWWSYNEAYVLNGRFLGLPVEEIAFFFVVPFACVVVFAGIQSFTQQRVRLQTARWWLAGIAGLVLLLGASAYDRSRTAVDCLLLLGTLLLLWRSPLITWRAFWYWNGAVLLLCLVFNTLLTALPVVLYDEQFMTGWRLGTIPVEDFVYNFSLLNLFILAMHWRFSATQPADSSTGHRP